LRFVFSVLNGGILRDFNAARPCSAAMPVSQTSCGGSSGRIAPKDLQRLRHAIKNFLQSPRTLRLAERPSDVRDRRIAGENQSRVALRRGSVPDT